MGVVAAAGLYRAGVLTRAWTGQYGHDLMGSLLLDIGASFLGCYAPCRRVYEGSPILFETCD